MRPSIKGIRDLFFLVAGSVIAYHEFWMEDDPSPIGAFMVLFLWGLIPAFRAEDANVPSPLQILIQLLAAKAPPERSGSREEDREGRGAPEGREDREEGPEGKAGLEGQGDRVSRKTKSSARPSKGQDSS